MHKSHFKIILTLFGCTKNGVHVMKYYTKNLEH